MGKRLTDKQKKKIIADYVKNQNYRETARMNGVSDYTVKKVVQENPGIKRKLAQKEEQNTIDVLGYMQQQHEIKKELLSDLLKAMGAKAKNPDMFTNIKDLATAYGIILDKELKFKEVGGFGKPNTVDNKLLEAIEAGALEVWEDVPSVQQQADAGNDLVEALGSEPV